MIILMQNKANAEKPGGSERELRNISNLNKMTKIPKYVAVTGGNGMIGLELCQMLIEKEVFLANGMLWSNTRLHEL